MATDVNTAFAAEKTSQLDARRDARDARIRRENDKAAWIACEVAAGRMTEIATDRYRVTQGWDAGEIFTVRRNIAGQIAEVVANHGLDVAADGTVSLYSAVPAWHGLGQVIPGGISTIDSVLGLAGLDWDVEKVPALYEWDGQTRAHEGKFHTIRTDTGAALGAVGRDYQVIQNRRVFGFLQDLVDDQNVVWESAGALRGGRRVFVSMRVPDAIVIDRGGLDDEVILFIVALNSHDASSQSETVLTPWRPVCANTERFATRDARARWGIRHTSGALDRLEEARRTLGLTFAYAREFEAEETALARTAIALDDFDRLIAELWPLEKDATVRTRNTAARRRDHLFAMYGTESERVGRTAYAAERAVTDYLDHLAPRRPGKTMTEEIARATALLEGTDDDLKNKAHKRLMLLTRR
jgi:phage/plasmid-like protein (TIGR03299 family)